EPSYKLSSGFSIPTVGFGTWQSKKNEVAEAVKIAIKAGCRHIDCAAIYGNEAEIGGALKELFDEGVVKREDLFITSKLWNSCHKKENVKKHCAITLKHLGLAYLDLYLIHWPFAWVYTDETLKVDPTMDYTVTMQETWEAMEELVAEGHVRSIGVSNANVQTLSQIMVYGKIKPAANQVELHPYLSQPGLKAYCDANNIHLTAYSPLGCGKFVGDATFEEIAKAHNKPITSILLRWGLQTGFSVIPKSVTEQRIKDNLLITDFTLTEDEMKSIDALNKNYRTCDPATFWKLAIFD
ncbi:hypothetical protein SAMD00019534_076660, partial [Acytostelium subglobosum LB1]|uniref:hypothetical protein n=1 Tax=Acytostelium subglobosum LB1 TaxID=1410327 RepID=UPI0006448D63